jgi:CheY-like chemotaxis protein
MRTPEYAAARGGSSRNGRAWWSVGYAPDGDEVLEIVRVHDPELVIMDYSVQRVDGVTASVALHAERPAVEIMAFTSTSNPATWMRSE